MTITSDDDVLGGEPRIAGTRVGVRHVAALPDEDPDGLARTVDEVFAQYGAEDLENGIVDLDSWYDWLHE